MFNTDLSNKYSHIMRLFNEGFEDEIISVQEDGSGDYVAYARIYGTIILFTQDTQGFMDLRAISENELSAIIASYASDDTE